MITSATPPNTVEDIVDRLKDHVWTLLRAGQLEAAMVLVADSVEDYLRIAARVETSRVVVTITQTLDLPEAEPQAEEVEEVEVPEVDPPVDDAERVPLVLVEDATTWSIPLQVAGQPASTKLKIRKGR